ncbi:hypothetical protein KNO81_39595 [Paraburkholderia sediminicola]|nr:hypothetical protein [Paraburkholderia sediminicola]
MIVTLCRRCGLEKEESEFSPQKRNHSGLQSACKQCHAEMGKAWYARNRQRRKEIAAAWRKDNAAHVYEVEKKWRAANADRFAEIQRTWKLRHPDRAREIWRQFEEARREERAAKHHAWYERNRQEQLRRCQARRAGNPHLRALYTSNRRARMRRQMPGWSNVALIAQFYIESDLQNSICVAS